MPNGSPTQTGRVTANVQHLVLAVFYVKLFYKRLQKKFLKKLYRSKVAKAYSILPPEIGEEFVPPGVNSSVFNGFVSSQNNNQGMQVKFHHDKNHGVACEWICKKAFEGYPKALHGGASFALLDELLAYAVFQKYNSYAVTVSSTIQWKASIKIDSTIKAKAQVISKLGRLIKVKGWIFKASGKIAVEMTGIMYIPSKREFAALVDLSIMPSESLPHCGIG